MFVQHITSQALAVYINNKRLKDDDFEEQANKQKNSNQTQKCANNPDCCVIRKVQMAFFT